MTVASELPAGQNQSAFDGIDRFSKFCRWIDPAQKHIALSISVLPSLSFAHVLALRYDNGCLPRTDLSDVRGAIGRRRQKNSLILERC